MSAGIENARVPAIVRSIPARMAYSLKFFKVFESCERMLSRIARPQRASIVVPSVTLNRIRSESG